jgi:hypothetical protein
MLWVTGAKLCPLILQHRTRNQKWVHSRCQRAWARNTYLVESSKGELLFVKRILKRKDDEFQDVTSKFEVFKQQSSTKIVEIKS